MSDLSRKMFLAETAAVREHLAEQEQQATAKAEAALAPLKAKARELEARRRAEHRAAVLREAADRIEKAADEHPDQYVPQGLYDAADRLRRMADETATETPDDTLHACPGRWGGPGCRCFDDQPAAGARQDEPTVTVHAAPDMSPAAEEALGALIDVAKQQATDGWQGATEVISDAEVQRLAATGLVGYRQGRGQLLHCLHHKPVPASRWADFHEVTADDLPDGGICVHPRCGADLLAVQPAAGARQDGAET